MANMPLGDATAGEKVFFASGCASCHKSNLAGGEKFVTPFGTFFAPNITPHQTDGIGKWSRADFANAMLRGISPSGEHYYPAFPYTSYARMELKDVADLFAYLKMFAALPSNVPKNKVPFPFSQRRLIGLWKFLYFETAPLPILPTDELQRGQYLVRVLGHCGECHTPRNFFGAMNNSRFLLGARAIDGGEKIPSLSSAANWSVEEIEYALTTGFLPNYDTFGSTMSLVQENLAHLPPEDIRAIAIYLQTLDKN